MNVNNQLSPKGILQVLRKWNTLELVYTKAG